MQHGHPAVEVVAHREGEDEQVEPVPVAQPPHEVVFSLPADEVVLPPVELARGPVLSVSCGRTSDHTAISDHTISADMMHLR